MQPNKMTAIMMLAAIGILMPSMMFGKGREKPALPDKEAYAADDLSGSRAVQKCEKYMTDHFVFREFFTKVRTSVIKNISEPIVNDVFISSDMLLDARCCDRPSAGESAVQTDLFASHYTGAVYFTAVPTSAGVYGERLPEYLLTNPEDKQISDFYEKLDNGIRRIDAFTILKAQNENYIYYRTDTRPTGYGAYYVYRTVIQKLGFSPVSYDRFTIEHVTGDFKGNLWEKCRYRKVKPDVLDVYKCSGGAEILECTGFTNEGVGVSMKLYDKDKLNGGDMYKMYLGEDLPFINIKTSVNNDRKLLLIKDSYADCFVQFLVQHYSEIAIISPEHIDGGLSHFIDPDDYEQTLFLFGADSLYRSDIFKKINS